MIPIFRAKKLDSDEYIIGDLFDGKYIISKSELNRDISEALKHIREDILTKDCISAECKNEHNLLNKMLNKLLVNERLEHIYEIDPTTLSIHFPNMLDSQGNKIFASLSENGKGGDILIEEGRYEDGFNPIFEPYFRKSSLSIFDLPKTAYGEYQLKYYKIIGIQQ